jgi:membrane protein YqaA with SNARE-associated domain
MLQRLYDWTLSLASRRHALWALAAVSFTESSVFPVPPDALLVPMCLARRDRCWTFAAVCTVASVVGGLAGYAIGAFLMETVGAWIISVYGYETQIAEFRQMYQQWGLWMVLIGGLTPFPYKVVTILSGAAQFDPLLFTLASAVTRGARFFLVAGLLWLFGPPIRDFIERRLPWVAWGFLAALILGFVAVTYL